MTTATDETYRPCNPRIMLAQIGIGNILAISGGRTNARATGVSLPVAHGYSVEIDLQWHDVYLVRRVFTRGGKQFVKGEREAYADEVGEVAYRASCYHHEF